MFFIPNYMGNTTFNFFYHICRDNNFVLSTVLTVLLYTIAIIANIIKAYLSQ